MSTTDTRAAFEAWYAKRHPNYPTSVHENPTWAHASKMDDLEVWQAAIEAAKATGTAGEVQIDLPAIVKRLEDAVRHMDSYGYVGIGRPGAQSVINDISGALKRAARQPAPVAIKTWQERVSESNRTDRFKVGDCMTDEIAELRAALAATAAPVGLQRYFTHKIGNDWHEITAEEYAEFQKSNDRHPGLYRLVVANWSQP